LQKFQDEEFPGWTLAHALFADMGGFILTALELNTLILLDAKQLFYLVRKEYVDYPTLSKEEIDDKNKSDG